MSQIKCLTLTLLGCTGLTTSAFAAPFAVEPHWAGVQLGISKLEVDGGDLDDASDFSLELGRWFTANLGVELGLSTLRDAKESGEDNRGTYIVTVDANEFYVGPRLSTSHFDVWRFFGSAGLLYSEVDIEVEEAFFDMKPGGTKSVSEKATGYYVGGGLSYAPPGRVDFSAQVRYHHRPGVIESYAGEVDIDDASLNLGVAYRF